MTQFIKNKKWIVIILCILVGIYFLWPIITDMGGGTPYAQDSFGQVVQEPSNSNSTDNQNGILVYISGAVQNPGLYRLEHNTNIGNAIQTAGGLLPYADVDTINLAESIQEGQHIHIGFNFHGNPESLLRSKKVNINTGTEKELDSLPGIGSTMAKRIIEYREQNGPFTKIEDIKHVKGIGDGLFKKIKDKITV